MTTRSISKGQVIEISSISTESFSIGNKSVISVRHNKKDQKFLIKGLMQGFSELKLWGKVNKTIKLYVLSKANQLNLYEVKNALSQYGLNNTKIIGPKLVINGQIKRFSTFKIVNEYTKKNSDQIISNLTFSNKLKKKILANIYFRFLESNLEDIKCSFQGIKILCNISPQIILKTEFLKSIRDQFHTVFITSNSFGNLANFKVEMRLLQVEKLDGTEISFGLDQIDINLEKLIRTGPRVLSNSSLLKLRSNSYDISTLSRPKALMKLNSPLSIKVGSEIPYSTTSANGQTQTSWKFAGLSVDLELKKIDNTYSISYTTKLTRPITSSDKTFISGNRQSSVVKIDLNNPIELFEIDLKTTDISKTSIPGLGSIPIINKLFSSNSDTQTYKKIVAVIMIKRMP